ncbi:periplasmic heavy metal sensor [Caulobacter sp. KR2-114]|uniref:periplasmic heavy metal sensor n=1 Tax=Caulobacter sp. KR2-114 TaxID=3400912 RepID=UPI003C028245
MSPRALTITLLCSLALNFFLLGAGATIVVVARAVKARAVAAQTANGPLQPVRRAALALPPLSRGQFAAAVKAVNTDQRPALQQARQLRIEAWTALGSDKVDAAAIKAKLDQARLMETGARSHIEAAIVDFTVKLPQDQRAKVGEEMRPQPQLQQQPAATTAAP